MSYNDGIILYTGIGILAVGVVNRVFGLAAYIHEK